MRHFVRFSNAQRKIGNRFWQKEGRCRHRPTDIQVRSPVVSQRGEMRLVASGCVLTAGTGWGARRGSETSPARRHLSRSLAHPANDPGSARGRHRRAIPLPSRGRSHPVLDVGRRRELRPYRHLRAKRGRVRSARRTPTCARRSRRSECLSRCAHRRRERRPTPNARRAGSGPPAPRWQRQPVRDRPPRAEAAEDSAYSAASASSSMSSVASMATTPDCSRTLRSIRSATSL
jgi:hypothetical protein